MSWSSSPHRSTCPRACLLCFVVMCIVLAPLLVPRFPVYVYMCLGVCVRVSGLLVYKCQKVSCAEASHNCRASSLTSCHWSSLLVAELQSTWTIELPSQYSPGLRWRLCLCFVACQNNRYILCYQDLAKEILCWSFHDSHHRYKHCVGFGRITTVQRLSLCCSPFLHCK